MLVVLVDDFVHRESIEKQSACNLICSGLLLVH